MVEEVGVGKLADKQPVRPIDHGAWSLKGRRDYQEDRFILHEYQGELDKPVLVVGVMDGHGGAAASKAVSESLPSLFSANYYGEDQQTVSVALEKAWDSVCQSYRSQCTSEMCVADYDPREGTLEANIGGEDLMAGTTTSVVALDERNGEITVLNCGDSRSLLVDKKGKLLFQTKDHSPQYEIERLQKGIDEGLEYSLPECSLSRWFLRVGDYQYALSRSLEGPFATSKGIVSTPDVSVLQSKPKMSIVVATDGIFEVMDSEEVSHFASEMRASGRSAADAAKSLCSMAIRKGSEDNVSAVMVYLE